MKDIPRRIRIGALQKKLLILLAGGASLMFSQTPRGYFNVINKMEMSGRRLIENRCESHKGFYTSKLIQYKEHTDKTVELVLDDDGKHKVLSYKLKK